MPCTSSNLALAIRPSPCFATCPSGKAQTRQSMRGSEATDRCEQARQPLLAIKHILDDIAVFWWRQIDAADIAHAAQPVARRPEDQCTDRVALEQAVYELRRFLDRPDEIPLELRNFQPPAIDVVQKVGIVQVSWFRQSLLGLNAYTDCWQANGGI